MQDRHAIVRIETTYIPGDERSRTNPGHGYPAHNVTNEVFKEYPDRESWEKAIKDILRYSPHQRFRAITFQEATVTQEVKVNIS